MLLYTKRTREVALALLECDAAVQNVYNMIEFHRAPDSEVSNLMSIKQLSELSNVGKRHIYRVLDELVDRELIEIAKTKKRGAYRFVLLGLKPKAEVVELPSAPQQTESTPETSEATGTDDTEPKRGFFGGKL